MITLDALPSVGLHRLIAICLPLADDLILRHVAIRHHAIALSKSVVLQLHKDSVSTAAVLHLSDVVIASLRESILDLPLGLLPKIASARLLPRIVV